MAAALYRIQQYNPYILKEISRRLNSFLPNFTDVAVVDDVANRQYIIKLKGEDGEYRLLPALNFLVRANLKGVIAVELAKEEKELKAEEIEVAFATGF